MVEDRARIVAYIRRKTQNQEDAEDIVQAAFMTAFRRIKSFRGECALRSWVTRIAINQFLMNYRKYSKHVRMSNSFQEDFIIQSIPTPRSLEDDTINKVDYEKLIGMVNQLPNCYRTAIMMRGEGLMYREIAAILGCCTGNVKSHVNRGKLKLLRALEIKRGRAEVYQPQ